MIEAMIDIETLDTKNSAVIFQIGLVIFEGDKILSAHQWNLDIDEQLQMGRTVSASTLAFHLGIPANLKNAIETRIALYGLSSVVRGILEVTNAHQIKQYWAKGNFDFNIIDHLYESKSWWLPWKYYQLRELRTLMQECNVPKGDVSHNALEDCVAQIKQLNACRAKIE